MVSDISGGYKKVMVSMFNYELTNLRMYGSRRHAIRKYCPTVSRVINRKVRFASMKFGISNNEDIFITGSKQAPKTLCKASLFGTWKATHAHLFITSKTSIKRCG